MRARHLVHRLFAALVGLWFGVLTAEPASLHACPMHDPVAAAATSGASQGHAHHAGTDRESPGSHHCTCIGTCATAAAPASPVAGPIPVALAMSKDPGIAAYTRFASAIEFAIPFANGPPQG